jgi:hypothetical protein
MGLTAMRRSSTTRRVASEWSDLIAQAWQKTTASIVETGRLLNEAKAELAHGEWLPMVSDDLPFSGRTAERLMAIADNQVLTNPTHASYLPPSWDSLYQLSRLDEETPLITPLKVVSPPRRVKS